MVRNATLIFFFLTLHTKIDVIYNTVVDLTLDIHSSTCLTYHGVSIAMTLIRIISALVKIPVMYAAHSPKFHTRACRYFGLSNALQSLVLTT